MKQPQAERLQQYLTLIRKYHAALDLMSPAGLRNVDRQLEDGLAYANLIEACCHSEDRILDVGSGVGLPAIPVALHLPYQHFYLVERRRKRSAFLRLVAGSLELDNVTVLSQDVSTVMLTPCAFILAQAVGSFSAVYCLTRHLHAREITLISRKGAAWRDEVDELRGVLDIKQLDIHEAPLATRGRLIALRLPGGRPCPSSA